MRHLVVLLTVVTAVTESVWADIPGWFKEAATTAHPAYPPQTKGVALFNEEVVTVEPTGKRVTVVRKAIKVLTRDGRREASGGVEFDSKGSKVRDFKAWLIYPTGKQKEFSKKEFTEGSSQPSYTLYSTRRFQSISAADEVDPGAVFGYEATVEEDSVFSQFLFWFQDDLPHLLSRFQLTVPAGWKAEAKAYGGAVATPSVNGNTYTWEARKLAPEEPEPGSPRLSTLLPRIAVSMIPPDGTAVASGPLACFRSWKDVSVWKSALVDPQAQITEAIEAKSAELVAGKASTLDKIEALSEFVQKIRYVNVSIHSARGGGYIPNKASEILRLAYGDCKDKSNLLRTMLKTIGVESFPVSVYSGDPRHTLEDFPSPYQFNHAILAIRIDDSVKLPAAATYPGLGRVLFFDPTDTNVAFGYIPDHEQNSQVLIMAGDRGQLVSTPSTLPAENHTERAWKALMQEDGSVKISLVEVSKGQAAFDGREMLERLSKEDLRKGIEARVSRKMSGAVIDRLATTYDGGKREFRMELELTVPSYAKVMADRLFMVRSAPLDYRETPNVNPSQRKRPLVIQPASFSEVVEWTLPEKWKLDELPDQDARKTEYGSFAASWKQDGTKIEMRRRLELTSNVLAVGSYAGARDFFQRFHGAGEAPVVLVKK